MEGSRWDRSGRTWQAVSREASRSRVGRMGQPEKGLEMARIVTKGQPEKGVQAACGVKRNYYAVS